MDKYNLGVQVGSKGEIREWEGGDVLARLMVDAVWGGRLVVCPRVSKKEASCGRGSLERLEAVGGRRQACKLERRHWVLAVLETK